MNIIDSLAKRLGYAKAKQPQYPSWALERGGVEQWTIPDGATYEAQANLYRLISWIQIAISMPAQIAALTPLNVFKIQGEKRVDIPNHPFELLLENPNPLQSRFEFLRDTATFWLLNANAYWFLNSTSETQPPSELWLIPPSNIKVVPDKNSFIQGYDYDPGDGGLIRLEPWQIVPYKDFHPNSMFVGLAKMESIAVDAQADRMVSKYNAQLYGQNNGRLPGIIAFANMINDPDWATIKRDITQASKTQNNMLLRGTGSDISWMQASGTIREMETYEGRQFTKEEVYSLFSPGLASMLAINATEANSKTGKATLIEFCVYPLQVAMSEKISQLILPRYGEGMVAAFDDIRISDRALQLQEIAAYSATHTVNEIREEHYGDLPDTDPERGGLFPSQITPPQAQQPAPAPGAQPMIEEPVVPELSTDMPDEMEPEEPEEPENVTAEKRRWQRKALNAIKAGKAALVQFDTDIIPVGQRVDIRAGLATAKTSEDVKAVFGGQGASKSASADQVIEMLRLATDGLKSAMKAPPYGHEFYGNQYGMGSGGGGGGGGDAGVGGGDHRTLVSMVEKTIGITPSIKSVETMESDAFTARMRDEYGQDLGADTIAAINVDGVIVMREGYEDSALHEYVHSAGFIPDGKGISPRGKRGLTQALTIDLAQESGMSVRSGYTTEVDWVNKYIIPVTGMERTEFFKEYAKTPDKQKFIAGKIWDRHGDKFNNVEDWGASRERFMNQVASYSNNDTYLNYLVDELGVKSTNSLYGKTKVVERIINNKKVRFIYIV